MNKTVIAVAAVALAAVAAQAQDNGARKVTSDIWLSAYNAKQQTELAKTIAQKVEQARFRHYQKNAQAQAACSVTSGEKCAAARPEAARPEGETVAPKTVPAAKSAKSAKKPAKGKAKQIVRAIFLGGKFPGESDQAYRQRLVAESQPAAQAFK